MNRKNIILNDSAKIDLTCQSSLNDILIVGNFNGMFGRINESGLDLSGEPSEEIINNFMWLNDTCRDAKKIFIGTRSSVGDYVKNMMAAAENLGIQINRDKYNIILVDSDDELLNKLNEISHTMPKFDYIIQNPPYAKTLHIDFFKKGIELLNDTGKMTIIEPATWLMNLRNDNGKGKALYFPFKSSISKLVEYVEIENLNNIFGIGQFVPCSITHIYKNKQDDVTNVKFFGLSYKVKSLDDINHIQNFKLVNNIISKIRNICNDFPKQHITNIECGDSKYIKYNEILSHTLITNNERESGWINDTFAYYLYPCVKGDVLDNVPMTLNNGGRETDKPSKCLHGTYQELSNWKHFCENNTLPLFINICMTIDQHNNSLKYVPCLVDKQYTDQEIYEMFHFTQQEINLIEYTVEKFKRNTPWTQRMIYGPSKVSDQEVQEYIENLKKKHNIDY